MPQLHSAISAVVVLLTVSSAYAQTYGSCAQSSGMSAGSGNFETFATGVLHDLGRYDVCTTVGGRFCSAYYRVMCVKGDGSRQKYDYLGCTVGPALGLCVPPTSAGCTLSLLNEQLFNLTTQNPVFQELSGYGSLCLPATAFPDDCTNASFGFLEAECMGELPQFTADANAKKVFAVIVVVLGLNVLAACAACIRRFRASSASNVDNADTQSMASTKETPDGTKPLLLNGTAVAYSDFAQAKPTPTRAASPFTTGGRLDLVSWFDAWTNIHDFFVVKRRGVASGASAIDTEFFEGVRTIAMLFVMYGHTLYFAMLFGYGDAIRVPEFVTKYESIGVFPAELAVDTFFFLSAFLVFHLYVKTSEKRRDKLTIPDSPPPPLQHPPLLSIPLMIVRRYLRMTPVVMLTLFASVYLLPYIPNGTMAGTLRSQPMLQTCHDWWWHQLLYISNLHDMAGWMQCMGWFWYLSTDFQLFIVAPIIIAVYFFDRRLFMLVLAVWICVTTGVVTKLKYGVFLGGTGVNYDKPWFRCNPYFYGMLAAALVREVRVRNVLANAKWRWVSYAAGGALMISSINVMWHGMQCYEQRNLGRKVDCPSDYYNFMNPFAIAAWGLGMLLVSVPWCVTPSVVHSPCRLVTLKSFLSHPAFALASKLTFCCYMLHPMVIMMIHANEYAYPMFSPQLLYSSFAGVIVITFVSAFLLHVFVEVPFAKMNDALTKISFE